jgi:hypothetical protein
MLSVEKYHCLISNLPSGVVLWCPPALRWTGCTTSSRLSWAGPTATIIKEYTIKAYVMDDERIKSGDSILTEQ